MADCGGPCDRTCRCTFSVFGTGADSRSLYAIDGEYRRLPGTNTFQRIATADSMPTRLARTAAVNALLLSILHAVIACWHKCARGTFICRIAVAPPGVTVNFSGEQTRRQTNLAILRVGDKAKRVQLRQMETAARRKYTVGPTQPISATPAAGLGGGVCAGLSQWFLSC